jgi:hypothetical protein
MDDLVSNLRRLADQQKPPYITSAIARIAMLEADKSPDKNVEAIRASLLERSRVGFKKYGVTTERTDLELVDWLRHLQEEMLDAAVYIEAAIKRIKDAKQ